MLRSERLIDGGIRFQVILYRASYSGIAICNLVVELGQGNIGTRSLGVGVCDEQAHFESADVTRNCRCF